MCLAQSSLISASFWFQSGLIPTLRHNQFLMSLQDVIWHECAPRFPLDVVKQHLPGYTVHEFPHPKHPDKFMALSQHQFGWPSHRPRRYSMLVKDSSCAEWHCSLGKVVSQTTHQRGCIFLCSGGWVAVGYLLSVSLGDGFVVGAEPVALGNIEPVGDLVGAGSGREEGICTQEMPAVKFTLRKFASWYISWVLASGNVLFQCSCSSHPHSEKFSNARRLESLHSSIAQGTKRVWLDIYRKSPKVKKMILKLRSQGRCNHHQ